LARSIFRKCLGKFPDLFKRYLSFRLFVRSGNYKKYLREKREVNRISVLLQKGELKNLLIVYDNLVSPPTYGDYFYVVMLARYFTTQDIIVNFVIVDGEYREDWLDLKDDEKKNLVSDYQSIASALLAPDCSIIEVLSSQQLQTRIQTAVDGTINVLFREEVTNRNHIYTYIINSLNRLCFNSSRSHLDSFLLSSEELALKFSSKKPEEPYITWGCRYSEKWAFDRNLSDEEFLLIYDRLKTLYPNHAVIIVSDSLGCKNFKRITTRHGLTCLFSKDFSDNIMGDGTLVLGSDYFFMARCGGIVVFPWFSRVPYELVIELGHETPWNFEMLFSWASKKQIWRFPAQRERDLPTLVKANEN